MNNTQLENVSVSGIPLYALSMQYAIDKLIKVCEKSHRENLCVSATGAHGIVTAQKEPSFKKLLNKFYMNLPDGMPSVWMGWAKGCMKMERCYGPDFFAGLMESSADTSVTHYLCGGREGVAVELKNACEEKFGNHNIVGTFSPPFKDVDDFNYQEIAKHINYSGADIVWIGISTPKQEEFAWRLSNYTNVHFLITVGAAFDFHIGNVQQAPSWMQAAGLEWFFRLCMEPRRLWKRDLEVIPLFLYYSIIDLAKFKTKSKSRE